MIIVSDIYEPRPFEGEVGGGRRRTIESMIQEGVHRFIAAFGRPPSGILLNSEARRELTRDFWPRHIEYHSGQGKFFRKLQLFETDDVRVAVV